MTEIRLAGIVEDTTVDGPGFRIAIYAAGCPHDCPGCHNPGSRNLYAGKPVAIERIYDRIISAEFSGVTFSGGDPMMQVEQFTALARMIKEGTDKTIWCYTGYNFEEIVSSRRLSALLPFLDVIVDGPFIASRKTPGLRFRGSDNQRIIDVPATLATGSIALVQEYMQQVVFGKTKTSNATAAVPA